MTTALATYRLAYTPIPKVACTSLKTAWYELTYDRPFSKSDWRMRLARGRVHRIFPSKRFDAGLMARLDGYWKFAVVRDPAERILSVWSSKVGKRNMLARDARRGGLRRLFARPVPKGLPLSPSLDEFVLRLDEYRAAFEVIESHTEPASYYLGDDLAAHDAIYRLDQIAELEAAVTARTGCPFKVPVRNVTPSDLKVTVDDLSDDAFDALMARLTPEYGLLAAFYSRPRRDRKLNQTGT